MRLSLCPHRLIAMSLQNSSRQLLRSEVLLTALLKLLLTPRFAAQARLSADPPSARPRSSLLGELLKLRRSICALTLAHLHRDITTQSLSPAENLELLNKQRALRPNSPWHIYQPQLTSVSSVMNRVTGAGLSVGECHSCNTGQSDRLPAKSSPR